MVDLSFLEKFTRNNPKKMKRYISMYLDGTPKLFEDMENYLKNENWEQLKISAHSLKPQAELIGISSLFKSLVEIEDAVKEGNYSSLKTIFINIKTIHNHSQKELKEQIKKL